MKLIRQLGRNYCHVLIGVLIALPSSVIARDSSLPPIKNLTVGETFVIEVPNLKRVAVGSGDILQADAVEATDEVIIMAQEAGISDVVVWDINGKKQHYLVNVMGYVEGPNEAQVRALISNTPGIRLHRVENNFVIDGMAEKVRDHQRLVAIDEQYENIISLAFPPEFERQETVQIHAQFLEVNRNALQEIGVDWADAINGPIFSFMDDFSTNDLFRGAGLPAGATLGQNVAGLPNSISGAKQYFGISTSLTSAINLLKTNGDAKLLAEPTLSAISGGSAKFLAGGDIPIPVTGNNGQISVIFRDFGIGLEIQPIVDDAGYIQTEVNVEVSAIDNSISVLGIPGFSKREATTQMQGESGQTIVLAGLFSQEESKAIDRLPGLGDIPIIGELFKSRGFRNDESELVVLVTPRVVNNREEAEKGLELFNRLQRGSDEALKFSIMD